MKLFIDLLLFLEVPVSLSMLYQLYTSYQRRLLLVDIIC